MTRRMIAWLLLVTPILAQGEIGNGEYSVSLDPHGLIVGVPDTGLRTEDGPRVRLRGAPVEWFGLRFDQAGVRREFAAAGVKPDWGAREPVRVVSFRAGADRALSVTRAGPLEVRTAFSFDPHGPYLILEVELQNRGEHTLEDVLYTREWDTPGADGWTFPAGHYALAPAPRGVCRRAWMLDPIAPGELRALTLSYRPDGPPPSAPGLEGVDVPLSQWTSASFPSGLNFGKVLGISFGDYDGDGYIDVYASWAANLWRNVGGTDWQLATNFVGSGLLRNTTWRYGSAFADFDRDGDADLGIEPRDAGADRCLHLLRNEGGGSFVDITRDAQLMPRVWCGDAETWCWADVDGDRELDAFVPFYPASVGSGPGNVFYHNLGPTLPGGEHAFEEKTAASGLGNPPLASRPEGAFFVDTDGDGDLDLFCNGTLYMNRSTPGNPDFLALAPTTSGISVFKILDEGAQFADYDLDGDQDLLIVYSSSPHTTIWESLGDGSFFEAEAGIVQSPTIGLNLGLSAEDWDNDGDIDFTTRHVFRRNMLMETGTRLFQVASHSIPAGHISAATPAWGDWDKDGDLDCALGNWNESGRFYQNDTYTSATPPASRRYVRVKVLRPSADVPEGLETEFGAVVELDVEGDPYRREKVVSSAAGYLNQNEYTLTFGLPTTGSDVEFDVSVDFNSPGAVGLWRVDRMVNPALGNVKLSALASREIHVLRDGEVRIDGVVYPPSAAWTPRLVTSAGGLVRPGAGGPLPPPVAAPGADTWVGLAFDTHAASGRKVLKEIVLDGALSLVSGCGANNVILWDVTDPLAPFVAAARGLSTSRRNHRSSLPVAIRLEAGRDFRLVAHVEKLRATSVSLPVQQDGVQVLGGLLFQDSTPCEGSEVLAAALDPLQTWLAIRFSP